MADAKVKHVDVEVSLRTGFPSREHGIERAFPNGHDCNLCGAEICPFLFIRLPSRAGSLDGAVGRRCEASDFVM